MIPFCLSGLYAPLTAEGHIVVDGVLASCYANFDHDIAHIAMKPMQWFPGMMEWVFGLDNNGLEGYVGFVVQVGRMLVPQMSV